MAKFRKKPIEIEAFCFGYDDWPQWATDAENVYGAPNI